VNIKGGGKVEATNDLCGPATTRIGGKKTVENKRGDTKEKYEWPVKKGEATGKKEVERNSDSNELQCHGVGGAGGDTTVPNGLFGRKLK